MNEGGTMTNEVMSHNFPGRKVGLALVTLVEHDGEHMWQFDKADGLWHRLQGEEDLG